MKKTTLIISLLIVYSGVTSSYAGAFFYEKAQQKAQLLIGDLIVENNLVVNQPTSFKIPIEVIANKPYDLVAFYTSDEIEYKKSVSFNGEVATFNTVFKKMGNHDLSLHLIVDEVVYKYTFKLYVDDDKPKVSFNYYNDKKNIYIDASSTSSVSNFESFIFSFDGQLITSKTPYASFPIPSSYGFYEINVSVLNKSQKMTSLSKSFTRSFIPIDINVNLDNKKTLSLILNEQAHFNLDFPSIPPPKEKLVHKTPAFLAEAQKLLTLQDTIESISESRIEEFKLSNMDLSDSLTLFVQLSNLNLQDDQLVNLYFAESVYLPSSDITLPEFSRLTANTIKVNSSLYILKPLKIYSLNNEGIFDVIGTIMFNDKKYINKEDVGSKTIKLKATLVVKQ
jgi:hypothetical protein